MEEVIKQFLSASDGFGDGYGYGSGYGDGYGYGDGSGDGDGSGYGDGSGFGDGYGYGSGYGDGYGYGDGSGYGDGHGHGDGDGYGDGYGSGSGIATINGEHVYDIDCVQTLIDSVHGNYAKGRILQSDLTTRPCFIAKVGNCFAHGETLRAALADARVKYEKNKSLDERIADFNREFPDRDKKVAAAELFRWHNVLTGSCLMGREQFCKDRGLDYKHGRYTVNEFIALTREAYGKEAIQQLERTLP